MPSTATAVTSTMAAITHQGLCSLREPSHLKIFSTICVLLPFLLVEPPVYLVQEVEESAEVIRDDRLEDLVQILELIRDQLLGVLPAVGGKRHQDDAPVVGVTLPLDDPFLEEPVDGPRRHAVRDFEPVGDLRHRGGAGLQEHVHHQHLRVRELDLEVHLHAAVAQVSHDVEDLHHRLSREDVHVEGMFVCQRRYAPYALFAFGTYYFRAGKSVNNSGPGAGEGNPLCV